MTSAEKERQLPANWKNKISKGIPAGVANPADKQNKQEGVISL